MTAAAQARENINAARVQNRMNRYNTYTPFGSVVWEEMPADSSSYTTQQQSNPYAAFFGNMYGSGGTATNGQGQSTSDRWNMRVNLDPRLQGSVDRVLTRAGNDFDLSGLPGMTGEARDRVEAALFNRLNPQLDRQREALDVQLRNQGLVPGTEAWRAAMDDWNRGASDQRLAVTTAGGQEAMNAFTMEMQRALAERQVPMNELMTLLSGAQQAAGAGGGGANVQPADYISAVSQQQAAQNQAYQARVANANSANATAGAVGAAAITAAAVIA